MTSLFFDGSCLRFLGRDKRSLADALPFDAPVPAPLLSGAGLLARSYPRCKHRRYFARCAVKILGKIHRKKVTPYKDRIFETIFLDGGYRRKVKAMILAAGEGTRLQPLTYAFPKPLVPVVNKPVMEHILLWLARHGITDILINTHFLAEEIENYFQDGSKWGVRIRYSREDRLWGTAGGVKRVADFFEETFLVIGGDDLSDVNLSKLIDFHHQKKAIATLGLKEVEETEHYGVVLTNAEGKIIRFQEKPKLQEALSRSANTGIYLFNSKIFDFIPDREVFDFGRQVFPLLLEKNVDFFGCPVEGYWCDIGTLAEYKESHWAILEERCRVSLHGRRQQPGIWVEEPVSIHPTAEIQAPCALGKGTRIGERALLAGHVVTGRNTVIGNGVQLDRVITWDDCKIGDNAVLQDCVLGRGARVPAGGRLKESVVVQRP